MRTKGEHKRLRRKNEINSWVPHRRSFGCHATFPVLVTPTSYYVTTPRIPGLRKKPKGGGTSAYFPRLFHIRVIFCINKRLISECQSLEQGDMKKKKKKKNGINKLHFSQFFRQEIKLIPNFPCKELFNSQSYTFCVYCVTPIEGNINIVIQTTSLLESF